MLYRKEGPFDAQGHISPGAFADVRADAVAGNCFAISQRHEMMIEVTR